MGQNQRLEPGKLVIRYALALALLVMFVLGGHGLHIATMQQGILDEEVLNISGRQRMLSQRIVLAAHRYNSNGSLIYEDVLADSVELFETSHLWLVENAIEPDTQVYAHYMTPDQAGLDQRSLDFVRLARKLLQVEERSQFALAIAERLEELALVGLLGELNVAVTMFEAAANDRAARLERVQIAVVVATLVVIVLEVLLIFYPAHRTMGRMIKKLRHQAWHDQLTGLINRTEFVDRTVKLSDANRGNLDQIILMGLDLDGFKEINDTLGHPSGDQVLKSVASRIQDVVNDFACVIEAHISRVGGDEFLISFQASEGDPTETGMRLGRLLIDAVEQPIELPAANNNSIKCTVGVSIGFAQFSQAEGGIEAAVSNADMALYESKQSGKGRTTAFTRKMREKIEREQAGKQELRAAIRGLEFSAYFQPQIDLGTGKLAGVEALARWNHPERGLVGPSEFIEIAEKVRLLDALDGQIILDAFEKYRYCKSIGVDLGILSINTSSLALRDLDFCENLVEIANAHEIAPSQVTVEILENILVSDGDPALETINRLSKAGFGVAIDDFGVGFSALARVGYLDVSAIKIDRSLTAKADDPRMQKVLKATAAMAKGLEARLLAEGIETAAQKQMMHSLGAELGQGFLWSTPVNVEELCAWVRNEHRYRLAAI